MRTIAILCGGGPAPGINTVVATVTKVFLKDGFRVLAIHEGYKGLFAAHPEVEELTYEKADQIYSRGGSAIKYCFSSKQSIALGKDKNDQYRCRYRFIR